jgi:hypothetical protein
MPGINWPCSEYLVAEALTPASECRKHLERHMDNIMDDFEEEEEEEEELMHRLVCKCP